MAPISSSHKPTAPEHDLRKAPVLQGPSNWHTWLAFVKKDAEVSDVWRYLDPSLPEVPALVAPRDPEFRDAAPNGKTSDGDDIDSIHQLTAAQLTVFQILEARSNKEHQRYQRSKDAIKKIHEFIQTSISPSLAKFIEDETSARDMLVALKGRSAPTDHMRELEVTTRYKQKLANPQLRGYDSWCDSWITTLKELKDLKLPEAHGTRPTFAFLDAVSTITPTFADPWKVIINARIQEGQIDQVPDGPKICELWRLHMRQARLTQQTSSNSSFATQSSATLNDKPPSNSPPPCICGDPHFFGACPYYSSEARAPGWTPDPAKQQKFDKGMKQKGMAERFARSLDIERKKQTKTMPTPDAEAKASTGAKFHAKRVKFPSTQSFASQRLPFPATHATASTQDTDIDYALIDSYILDSGSDGHVSNNRDRFIMYEPAQPDDYLIAGSQLLKIEGFGEQIVNAKDAAGITVPLHLVNVAYVPSFLVNAVSWKMAEDKGFDWSHKRKVLITPDGEDLCVVPRIHGQNVLEYNPPRQRQQSKEVTDDSNTDDATDNHASFAKSKSRKISSKPRVSTADEELWHTRLGHPGPEATEHLIKQTTGAIVKGINTIDCQACSQSKGAKRVISRRSAERPPRPFYRCSVDWVSFKQSFQGYVGALVIKCDATGLIFVFPATSISMIPILIDQFIKMVYIHYNLRVAQIRSDNDSTLKTKFKDWCAKQGIEWLPSSPYTPAQDGSAERAIGIITAKATAMRLHANLPHDLWPEIIIAAAYLHNITPSETHGWKTPQTTLREWLNNNTSLSYKTEKPSIAHLKAYGCRAYPLTRERLAGLNRLHKLKPRAHIGYLVGYDSSNIYRIWVPALNSVIRTRDVSFNETLFNHGDDNDEPIEIAEEDAALINMPYRDDEEPNAQFNNLELSVPPMVVTPEPTPEPAITAPAKTKDTTPAPMQLPTPEATPAPAASRSTTRPTAQPDSSPEQSHDDSSLSDLSDAQFEDAASQLLQEEAEAPQSQPYDARNDPAPRHSEIATDINPALIIPGGRASRRAAHHARLTQGPFAAFHTAINSSHTARLHRNQLPPEPNNFRELKNHRFVEQFKEAMRKEIDAIKRHGTWKSVKRTAERTRKLLPLRWVFKYKFNKHGFLRKFKARLCVRGDLQTWSDKETYAATLAARSFRILMAITAKWDLETRQLDAVNAFTNGHLDEEVYVDWPPGFSGPDDHILQLLKALYGLRRSPLLWLKELSTFLKSQGLSPVIEDSCIWVSQTGNFLVFFYVDDIVVLWPREHAKEAHGFIDIIKAKYEMNDLGELRWFLGIKVVRDRANHLLWLSQSDYIEKIAAKFHISKSTTVSTPSGSELSPYSGIATPNDIYIYQSKVGSAQFPACISRPDIAFTASHLASFLTNPGPQHQKAADQCLQYLLTTKDLCLVFGNPSQQPHDEDSPDMITASDASFARDAYDRKSVQGFVIKLFGGPILWKSSKQQTVTTSSTEAELLAISNCAKELYAINRLFKGIRLQIPNIMHIYCDNTQTIRLLTAETPQLQTRLRHVDIHHHWLRQEVQNGNIAITHLPAQHMLADGFTKPLPKQKLQRFVQQLGLATLDPTITNDTDSDSDNDDDDIQVE